MENSNKKIQLKPEYRGKNSSLFTGRPEGKFVRNELRLNDKYTDEYNYNVFIPSGTTSINASFFLGLFFESIKKMGSLSSFKRKYIIDLSEVEEELQPILARNLNECYRKAENELNNSTGLD